ncbi:thioredoxin [Tardiphaga alba]|uniref:Thioredoxin n=1 Tax=Tardiphaga alba TaxID=340268 RepID=A0ABX8AIL9_9BRAD|nr:thioredoxin [Tardiphaga alba]
MHIVCPNCTTSYAVNPAGFGDAGRTVRCARCKEVWLAKPEALAPPKPAMAASQPEPDEDLSAWGVSEEEAREPDVPVVESPSISADLPAEPKFQSRTEDADWTVAAREDAGPSPKSRLSRTGRLRNLTPRMRPRGLNRSHILPIATAAMAAFVMALSIWRVDIVRLMPQTAAFYQVFGLDVNIRGLAFKDVKITTETVDGKPVMLIEGYVVSETRVPTAMPRLRFVVRDEKGTEIYAWSAVLEQPGLNPGDKTWFKSRLASPPAEGRSIDVRFFNKRDVAA